METTSEAFRQVFARFSRGFRFKNIFVKGSCEQKNQFLRAAGAPARGAAEPGPPRHAKIGKNHPNQSVRPKKNFLFCFSARMNLSRKYFGSESLAKTLRKPRENLPKTSRKPPGNLAKTSRTPWESCGTNAPTVPYFST